MTNNLAFLSNLAGPDGFLIMFFVLIFFGAKRLPELARSMGSAVKEFQKAKDDFSREITSAPQQAPQPVPHQEVIPALAAPVSNPVAPANVSPVAENSTIHDAQDQFRHAS